MKYEIIRSARKTIALQILPGGQLVVRCPYRMDTQAIDAFVASKSKWIEKHLKQAACQAPLLSQEELQGLALQAKDVIPQRVAYYADKMGVSYGKITIRCAKTRWGSCTEKGNLGFNCLLMLTPPTVLDYVVVHELCHRKQMNHSKAFWAEVAKALPDYASGKKWLKDNGNSLISRIITR